MAGVGPVWPAVGSVFEQKWPVRPFKGTPGAWTPPSPFQGLERPFWASQGQESVFRSSGLVGAVAGSTAAVRGFSTGPSVVEADAGGRSDGMNGTGKPLTICAGDYPSREKQRLSYFGYTL